MKCSAEECPNEAEFTVFWPGQTVIQCGFHAGKATGVANAMGFHLTILAISDIGKDEDQEKVK